MNYSVADFIIRLKNASLARRSEVVIPFSKINKGIGKVLVTEKFIKSIVQEERDGKKVLLVNLRYERRHPVLTNVQIVSKPSLRVYISKSEIPKKALKRRGTLILSTSHGIMSGKEAVSKGVGGEFLFEVW